MAWQISVCAAEYDPTRPPFLSAAAPATMKAVTVNPKDFNVTAILISPQRKIAVVNNQVVMPGDSVKAAGSGKATVKDITPSAVMLVKAQQVFEVRLPSSVSSKTTISHSRISKTPVNETSGRVVESGSHENNEEIKESP